MSGAGDGVLGGRTREIVISGGGAPEDKGGGGGKYGGEDDSERSPDWGLHCDTLSIRVHGQGSLTGQGIVEFETGRNENSL